MTMTGGQPLLTLVVPAYNEADRIGPFLDGIVAYAARFVGGLEVLVVDDGSTDGTADAVAAWATRLPGLQVLRLPANRGKGAAVRAGLAAGTGRWRAFLDADGSTPVVELDGLLAEALGRPDAVVVGSIGVPGAAVEQSQVWVRQLAGRVGNLVIRTLAVPGVRDTQRGCKLLSARLCDEILPWCEVERWAFDVELLALARASGCEVVEVPVRWHHVGGSKVRAGSYAGTLLDVWRVRRRVRRLARAGLLGVDRVGATAS